MDFPWFAERHGLRDPSDQAPMSKSLLLSRIGCTGLEGRCHSISGENLLEQTLSFIPDQIPAELNTPLAQFLAHVALGDLVQVSSTPQPDFPSWLDYLVWLYLISVESGSHPFYLTSIVTTTDTRDGESQGDLLESIISGIRGGTNVFALFRIRDLYSSVALADRPGLIKEEHVRHVLDDGVANRFTILARCIREAVILLPESLRLYLAMVLGDEEVSGHRAEQIELEGRPRHASMFLTDNAETEWLRMETWRSAFQMHLFDPATGIWRLPLDSESRAQELTLPTMDDHRQNTIRLTEFDAMTLAIMWGNSRDETLLEPLGVPLEDARVAFESLLEQGICQVRYAPDLSVAGLGDEVFLVFHDPAQGVRPRIELGVPFSESVLTSKERTVMRLYVPPNHGIMLASYLRRKLAGCDPVTGLVKGHASTRTIAVLAVALRLSSMR